MHTLRVGAAISDPPFNGLAGGGLDVDLAEAIGARLDLGVQVIPHEGPDIDGIFISLAAGIYDCVIAGVSITPERTSLVDFAPPYLISGLALAVNARKHPRLRSVDDLAGLTIGVRQGDTGCSGHLVAERLVAEGRAAAVRICDGDTRAALSELAVGAFDAYLGLAPALDELSSPLPSIDVVQRGISREAIAIATRSGDALTLQRITLAQAALEADGTLQGIRRRWLGDPYLDQSLGAL